MKKITFFLLLFFLGVQLSAQTKNGTVYSEHETIEKTRTMWAAFEKGDANEFVSFFADSVYRFVNGKMQHIPKEKFKGIVDWWAKSYENLKIGDHKPAFPDAIEYKNGGNWVQDWLLFSGTHIETGINIAVHYHNLYSFNKEGKITSIHFYFDDSVFEEINNSTKTIENGKVYVNHPYILKVRKVLNAFMDKDVEKWASFFNPKAKFRYSWMKPDEWQTFDEVKERLTKQFETQGEVKMEQQGYPDCIYYAKNDAYVVYSWWTVRTEKEDKKQEYPLMFSHYFDKDGKILSVYIYVSTNHFE